MLKQDVNKEIRKVKLISRNVLVVATSYSNFNPLDNKIIKKIPWISFHPRDFS